MGRQRRLGGPARLLQGSGLSSRLGFWVALVLLPVLSNCFTLRTPLFEHPGLRHPIQASSSRNGGCQRLQCFFSFGQRNQPSKAVSVPQTYEAICNSVCTAVQAGLKGGLQRMEIEFPPLGALNKLGDGSAQNRDRATQSNIDCVAKLVAALARSRKVWVICCEPGTKGLCQAATKGKAEVVNMDERNLPPAGAKDVQIVLTPGDFSQWKAAKRMSEAAPTVIVNGLFNFGYAAFEQTYYFKPISGWGFLLKQYPGDFTVILGGGGNEVIPCDVDMIQQGELRRPNLGKVSTLLSNTYNQRIMKGRT